MIMLHNASETTETAVTTRLVPCLWFDRQAEEAARFYTSIFKNSRIVRMSRYGEAGREIHGGEPGAVLTVEFELDGQPFTALNGGPAFTFSEAISFQVFCETQAEIDEYWEQLSQGGDESAQQCGWLKDRYGVSWQIVPTVLDAMLRGEATHDGVMNALLGMKKIEIAELQRAYSG
jgi:predicted 3-demethylubiquinone-9 3-methyltransferase (glyoxalase superfamily)